VSKTDEIYVFQTAQGYQVGLAHATRPVYCRPDRRNAERAGTL